MGVRKGPDFETWETTELRIRKSLLPSGFFLKKDPPFSEARNGYTLCETALAFAP
jgi:hypothetical protein